MLITRFWLLLLLMASVFTFHSNAQEKNTLNTKDFESGINEPGIQILDVRTLAEYQSGHLKNALLADWTDKSQFKERVAYLDKTKPVYTYCLSGFRSNQAGEWMQKNGFTKVFNLEGGIAAWKKADKPVEGQREVKQITMEQYLSGIPSDQIVLVDIGAVWCPPCKNMDTVLDSLSSKKGVVFTLLKIDGGEQAQLIKELNINGFPTFIIYKEGRETWRKQGMTDLGELTKQLQ